MLRIKNQAEIVAKAMIAFHKTDAEADIVSSGSTLLFEVYNLLQEIKEVQESTTAQLIDETQKLSN